MNTELAPQPRSTSREGSPPPAPGFTAPIGGAGLMGGTTPSLRLPGHAFAAALGFWLLGAAGLVWVAPDLAQGLFPLPRVAAVTHLFTLGWITTTIQGALYQFLPVALQVPIRSERVAYLSSALYVPGLLLFLAGLLSLNHPVLLTGATLFGTGLLLFVGNLAGTLRRCEQRTLTWWALVGAATSLLATVVLGVSLAGNLGMGYLGENRFLALGVHIHVAAAGWIGLVMVGVAHRLLPMFLLSHGASEWPGRFAVGLIGAGVAVLLAFHHQLTLGLKWAIALLLMGGVGSFLVQAALFFRYRKKPALDPGLRLAAFALLGFVCAVAIAPFVLTLGFSAPRAATAYAVSLILGGFSLFVAGHYYKIVPFLVWLHRFGPLVGKRPVPRVVDLYSTRLAAVAVTLLAGGSAGLTLSTLLGAVEAARPSALAFAVGAAVLALQMAMIARRRPA